MSELSSTPLKRGREWSLFAALLCCLFGLAMLLNIQTSGDGLWFWYAGAMRHHQRLYSDLHLNLQPLFVLANAASQSLLGTGWLVLKILSALQLAAYCIGLYLVSRYIPWKDWQRAVVILAAFGMTIVEGYYRFDDYHITTHCFELYAVYVLLLMWRRPIVPVRSLVYAAVLGVLSGLSVSNRLNDGAALFIACVLSIPFLVYGRKMLHLLTFCLASLFSFLAVIGLTGDTLRAWFADSVVHAAKIKGGTGNILLFPFYLPFHVGRELLHKRPVGTVILVFFVAAVFALLPRLSTLVRQDQRKWLLRGAAALLLGLEALLVWKSSFATPNRRLAELGVLLLFGVGVLIHVRLALAAFAKGGSWNRLQVLLLVPAWQLFAAAMTSGRALPEYEPAVALALLVAPIALPRALTQGWQRRAFLVVASVIAVVSVPAKAITPFWWHHFRSQPMFVGRQWYKHPVYGPMYLQTDQLNFFRPICATIHESSSPHDLLSLPYPFPNYFCDVPPWHGYVQTWYDTSGRETIDALDQELEHAPPRWIVYQRGLDSIQAHEHVFNGDRLLPHRDLDREVMGKVVNDQWTVMRRSCFQGTEWFLIRTTAPGSGEHRGTIADIEDHGRQCPNSPLG